MTPQIAIAGAAAAGFGFILRAPRAADGRFIFMGDFNVTPWSPDFRRLPGKRIGDPRTASTWLTALPIAGLPIDHVFIGEALHAHDFQVGGFMGSDHRPLFAEIGASP